jgi:uncharacterized protein YcfJ
MASAPRLNLAAARSKWGQGSETMKVIVRGAAAFLAGVVVVGALATSADAQSRRGYCDRVARDYANSQTAGNTVGGAVVGGLLGAGVGALVGWVWPW